MSWKRTRGRSSPLRSSRSSRRRSGSATRRAESQPDHPAPSPAPPLVILFGPTAVGKSEILTSLFDHRFEVINADSMQVYRHMDVGTAKPGRELRERLPHHLIDIVEPSYQFNAGEFVTAAESLVRQISA
ncbi:MAG TPA: hypothetical protein VMM82_08070, partial [Spirochaetia bacterium]|nr:hypothetical protein [Spirochaetia bacterium]